MLKFKIAKTHPAEYLLHKYWSRKPSDVLSKIIKEIQGNHALKILDPFCGSGVFLREASKLGNKAYGFDINPVAALLSEITCTPPNLNKFSETVEPILNEFKLFSDQAYKIVNNSTVRYVIHEMVVPCPKCKRQASISTAVKEGKIFRCAVCNERLHFNLKMLTKTIPISIQTESGIENSPKYLSEQSKLSRNSFYENVSQFIQIFPENKRILSYKGMQTKDLFTARNFSLLCWIADKFHKIKDTKIRKTALLMLTASVAQGSRLIASRNNMTTGGPAWSVPGFWVPALHLETNPYHHLKARFKKKS